VKINNAKKFFRNSSREKLTFISIKSNGTLNGKVYSHYNQKSPWQFRVEIINRKLRYDKLYEIKEDAISDDILKGWQIGRSASDVIGEMEKENDIARPNGLYIDRHSKFGETPDHRFYTDHFGSEYLFQWERGKKSRRKLRRRSK